jgi:hypothetical protein
MNNAKIISLLHQWGFTVIIFSPFIIYKYPKTYKPFLFSQLLILSSWGGK